MIDKGVIVSLFERGWSQAKIARRFKVTRGRICQIVRLVRQTEDNLEELKCEICDEPMEKEQYVEVEGADPFLVCDKCREKI